MVYLKSEREEFEVFVYIRRQARKLASEIGILKLPGGKGPSSDSRGTE